MNFRAFIGSIFKRIFLSMISNRNGVILFYNDSESQKVFTLIKQIKKEKVMLLKNIEAYNLFMAVRRTEKVAGDIAEVGTFAGGAAKIICEAKRNKTLHLFDTFEGLPNLTAVDNPKQFHKGLYSASLEGVRSYLNKYKNVKFYKGLFPSTVDPIKNTKFSFVHIDVDLYESTVCSIEFFYPRMNKGGGYNLS